MKNFFKSCLVALSIIGAVNATAQVPLLNSYPSATAVIYLDFDGHTVNGTAWNVGGPLYCGASGLNSSQITEVFNRVSEDYRPFNVNITTDSTKYLSAPFNRRMRVIFTVTSAWYGSGAGGVAFVNSFTWGDDTPCFIFTALLNYNVKNISEAGAHEAGHTLGLYHQSSYDVNCTKISDYNTGVGSGEIGWAPIMGVGYNRNLTLWNNGPNSYGCTNYQSDLDIITANNGFTYRNDDHGNTFATATTANFVSNQFNVSGVIERNTDNDMFKFTTVGAGSFVLSAVPYNVGTGNAGSDLDMQVTIYDNAQNIVNTYNPGSLLNSGIDSLLTPGTYYLKVEGKGNIYAPNYASLGSYSLVGTFSSIALPLRKLILQGNPNGDRHEFTWIIDADEQVVSEELQVSTDGRNFTQVVQTPNAARSYSYIPFVTTTAQYRLKVKFDNGLIYFSNIVTIRPGYSKSRPQVVNSLVSNSITINATEGCDYLIYDLNGKTLSKGQLTNGTNIIPASNLASGMYMIRFTNGTEQWIDKILRQ